MCERRAKIRALGVAVALLLAAGSEAWAAVCTTSRTQSSQTCTSWRTTSSGVKYCSLWCTGSMQCDNAMQGVGGNISKECANGSTEGVNCPVTECASYGTVEFSGESSDACNAELSPLNENCAVPGRTYCLKEDGSKEGIVDSQQGFQSTTSETLICDKKGKCTNSLKLPGEDTGICSEIGGQFVTFTAEEFKAKSCFCPGGFDGAGKCCADSTRTTVGESSNVCSAYYGTGASVGTPTCIVSLCTVDLTNYDPLTNFTLPYTCDPDTSCGGVSENGPCNIIPAE